MILLVHVAWAVEAEPVLQDPTLDRYYASCPPAVDPAGPDWHTDVDTLERLLLRWTISDIEAAMEFVAIDAACVGIPFHDAVPRALDAGTLSRREAVLPAERLDAMPHRTVPRPTITRPSWARWTGAAALGITVVGLGAAGYGTWARAEVGGDLARARAQGNPSETAANQRGLDAADAALWSGGVAAALGSAGLVLGWGIRW